MGDPKKQRKKYKTPGKPWEAVRIEEERKIINEYGLRNKKEIWKNESYLRRIKRQARRLISDITEQGKKEKEQLLSRLIRLNLIKHGAPVDDILALELKDVLERRLQTLVFRKNLSKSIKQSRQFIVHGHIEVNNKKMDVPSYLVLNDEEKKISFNGGSTLSSAEHPERFKDTKEELRKGQEILKKKEEPKEEKKVKEVKKEEPKEEKKVKEVKKEEPKEEKKEVKEETKTEIKVEEPKIEIKEVEVGK